MKLEALALKKRKKNIYFCNNFREIIINIDFNSWNIFKFIQVVSFSFPSNVAPFFSQSKYFSLLSINFAKYIVSLSRSSFSANNISTNQSRATNPIYFLIVRKIYILKKKRWKILSLSLRLFPRTDQSNPIPFPSLSSRVTRSTHTYV